MRYIFECNQKETMKTATWNGTIIAASDETIVVEGNHYFPPDSIESEFFKPSTTHTTCSWKGIAFELGIWGVSGDIYFTATRQYFENKKVANLDVTKAGLYDAYKIVSFDGATFVYRSLETGEEFTVRKIPKGAPIGL